MPSLEAVRDSNNAASLKGKVALCVGGSSGCGKGCALVLARQGCSVTIVGRNAERGAAAVAACKAASPADVSATFAFVSLDVRSLAGIKKFCDEFAASNPRLDLLTLSCTRGGIQGYRPSEEGFDERLLSMYLARFAFVHKLQPLLLQAPEPRVLSILSAGHHKPYPKWEADFLTVSCSPALRTSACGFYVRRPPPGAPLSRAEAPRPRACVAGGRPTAPRRTWRAPPRTASATAPAPDPAASASFPRPASARAGSRAFAGSSPAQLSRLLHRQPSRPPL